MKQHGWPDQQWQTDMKQHGHLINMTGRHKQDTWLDHKWQTDMNRHEAYAWHYFCARLHLVLITWRWIYFQAEKHSWKGERNHWTSRLLYRIQHTCKKEYSPIKIQISLKETLFSTTINLLTLCATSQYGLFSFTKYVNSHLKALLSWNVHVFVSVSELPAVDGSSVLAGQPTKPLYSPLISTAWGAFRVSC